MPSWKVSFDTHVHTDSSSIISLIAKCQAFASVIINIPITPNRQRKLDRLNILRAVRGTTGIEGTDLTEEEASLIIDAPSNKAVLPKNRQREEQEGRNATKLMRYVAWLLDKKPDYPLSETLIRKLHEITTSKIDYPKNIPGKYRSFAVRAGNYVPPSDGQEVQKLMTQFLSWFNSGPPSTWDPIIQAIIAHFYVVSIHPFAEGNGRTSRAVESFLLYKSGINARGFYSLSNFYYENRDDYVKYLDYSRFESNGDLTPFVRFALEGLANELTEVHKEVINEVKEIAFRDLAREMLQDRLATKAGERLMRFIFYLGSDLVSIKSIRKKEHRIYSLYSNLTSKTLARDISNLNKLELVKLDNGNISANIDIMGQFLPPQELIEI